MLHWSSQLLEGRSCNMSREKLNLVLLWHAEHGSGLKETLLSTGWTSMERTKHDFTLIIRTNSPWTKLQICENGIAGMNMFYICTVYFSISKYQEDLDENMAASAKRLQLGHVYEPSCKTSAPVVQSWQKGTLFLSLLPERRSFCWSALWCWDQFPPCNQEMWITASWCKT